MAALETIPLFQYLIISLFLLHLFHCQSFHGPDNFILFPQSYCLKVKEMDDEEYAYAVSIFDSQISPHNSYILFIMSWENLVFPLLGSFCFVCVCILLQYYLTSEVTAILISFNRPFMKHCIELKLETMTTGIAISDLYNMCF